MKSKYFLLPLIVLLILSVVSLRSCYKQKKRADLYREAIDKAKTLNPAQPLLPFKTFFDNLTGAAHVVVKPIMLPRNANLLRSGFISKEKADSLMKVIDAKEKDISSYTEANLILQAKLQARIKTDSLGRKSAIAQDSTISAEYFFNDSTFNIGVNARFKSVDYSTRKSFLHPYKYYTEQWSPDKRIKIENVYRITRDLGIKTPKWNISLGAGAALTPSGVKPAIILGLNRTIISL